MRHLLLLVTVISVTCSAQRFGVPLEDTRATGARSFSCASNSFSIDSISSILLRGRGVTYGTRSHLFQASGVGLSQMRMRAQTSLNPAAFAQIAVVNFNEQRPEVIMTAADTSFNGTSIVLKGDTLYMSIDVSIPSNRAHYIMENMAQAPTGDTTNYKILVRGATDNEIYWMHWPVCECALQRRQNVLAKTVE